jgi:hypothetical protein
VEVADPEIDIWEDAVHVCERDWGSDRLGGGGRGVGGFEKLHGDRKRRGKGSRRGKEEGSELAVGGKEGVFWAFDLAGSRGIDPRRKAS